MKMPCEYGVLYILPSIRACLVEEMIRLGIPQSRVAEMLGITPASVSQYTARKRGCKIEIGDGIKSEIQHLALEISQGSVTDVVARVCSICAMVRAEVEFPSDQNCMSECTENSMKVQRLEF